MVFKRKSAGRNGDQPRKRGRWAKRSPVAEEKDEAKEQAKEVIEQVSGEGTAAAPLKIKEDDVAADEKGHAESPVSVLCDEGVSVATDDVVVTEKMLEEEKRLAEIRAAEEAAEAEALLKAAPDMDESSFSKLDQLLNQTKMYSEFLLERMDDIALAPDEQEEGGKGDVKDTEKKGGGRRGAAGKAKKAKEAKEAMDAQIARVEGEAEEEVVLEDTKFMTEEERNYKEQQEICPLLTGGRLKGYQLKGIKWMISLWQNGLNGILADQMGLGKTVQTIGLLSHLKGKKMHGPFLIVGPLSTLSNWVSEIKRFVPSMNVLLYHSSEGRVGREKLRRQHMPTSVPKESFPVIVTSFEVAMNDRRFLAKYKWKYIIVDEVSSIMGLLIDDT